MMGSGQTVHQILPPMGTSTVPASQVEVAAGKASRPKRARVWLCTRNPVAGSASTVFRSFHLQGLGDRGS